MVNSSSLSAFSLDDFETRSGSATSIIRTITGLYVRHAHSPIPRPLLVDLALTAGISGPAAQTAISRLIERSVLESASPSALSVTTAAHEMFERGTRRIFTPRQMAEGDPWCLVTFSLPESLRPLRHQVRKHFLQLGGGLVGSGLWIFPEYLRSEVTAVLRALQASSYATIFTAQQPHFPGTAQQAAQQWWDLKRLDSLHGAFLEDTGSIDKMTTDSASAYRGYVTMIDAWRSLPYLDPGLPDFMLPASWLGKQSRERFTELSDSLRNPAALFVQSLMPQQH